MKIVPVPVVVRSDPELVRGTFPGDHAGRYELSQLLYNRTARPFSWKFTAADLHDLMKPHQRLRAARSPLETDRYPRPHDNPDELPRPPA
jgi:hypothetical protein